ncbi:hypothetical protein INT43_001623 [Umbelopsis isabellina]|uniref:UFSP1/2/DUB catalytic domain-containing protein n=1 Tax=Mortierella isabellina TaxID=91625 RepID=A0A8H7UEL4_MORIS|nr:hypothetical protein INT43_001623 [Umbelopsis isabellina]
MAADNQTSSVSEELGSERQVIDVDYAKHYQVRDALLKTLKNLNESSRTQGVIPQLKPHFISLNKKGKTSAAYLCSPDTGHIATGLTDLGWGCGYRNCQMLMTFLQRQQHEGAPLLDMVLNIKGLQLLIEQAWNEGFDPEGAQQLRYQVYRTRKWIGTTEVYTLLTYLGIRCTILDFDKRTGPNNSHDAMFDWIQAYFEDDIEKKTDDGPSPSTNALDHLMESAKNNRPIVHITSRPPIYIQHSGHSRTVIGIEVLNDGNRNLIMFDPGHRILGTYKRKVSEPEDDMSTSSIISVINENEDAAFQPEEETTSKGVMGKLQQWTTVPPSNLLRSFRVSSKTIAKNKQYQLLVLGEVKQESHPDKKFKNLYWNRSAGYLLDAQEREQRKKIGSFRVV